MTFFDFQGINKDEKGSDEIREIGFRVKSNQTIEYWLKRLDYYGVKYKYNNNVFIRKIIYFEDFDNQEYAIVSDENIKGINLGIPWKKGPVPNEFAITGLGLIFIRVIDNERIDNVLRNYLNFRTKSFSENFTLYEVGEGGNGASIIVGYKPNLKPAIQGYGSVHHMAFRIEDKKILNQWITKLNDLGARLSGLVDRFYFKSLYTRLYPRILFEFATEGPGFIGDEEKYETLGDKLALPPKFRNKRNYIEEVIRHIDTDRSKIIFRKEYLNE